MENISDEIIHFKDKYYILASSSLTDDRVFTLKQGETFAVVDRKGDILPLGMEEQGIYHEGTRYLSRFEFRVNHQRPLLLSSAIKEHNESLTIDLTNPTMTLSESYAALAMGTIHVFRSKFLWRGACYERFRVSNYGSLPLSLLLSFFYDADYADIFEVRGYQRKQHGQKLNAQVDSNHVLLGYEGLDQKKRNTCIHFSIDPIEITSSHAVFKIDLNPQQIIHMTVTISCEYDHQKVCLFSYDDALTQSKKNILRNREHVCQILTSNEQFNAWIKRSFSDLHLMITETENGLYPYAGIPWYCAPFGRDGLIAALETLWIDSSIAAGVLRYLAATQAKKENPERDAWPGKILHEGRKGEMAALGEIPFGQYYGTVDATPLFVYLAASYFNVTGDEELIREIWPHLQLALDWMQRYGDSDGDGFVEYLQQGSQGLDNQGWKDSFDSVFHSDGSLAKGPIALCEVQGYVYAAKRGMARIAHHLGEFDLATQMEEEARLLKKKFHEQFWIEEMDAYALALDGQKNPCRVVTSNMGHCLYTGIANEHVAARMVKTLFEKDMFSGWGIRTVSSKAQRYNPMSYHNGSIWPHDNALIAQGLNLYGFKKEAVILLSALFDASLYFDIYRLPELYCGFERSSGQGPTMYPVACIPQTWATASLFMLLQACMGLSISGVKGRLYFSHPFLPPSLQSITIKNLCVGSQNSIDLAMERHAGDVGVHVLRRRGPVKVISEK